MDDIAILGPAQMGRATVTLERAFSPDPMFTWIFPDPEKRSRSLRRLLWKHVPEPHWYLAIVAVDPALQGRGLGSALVKEGLMQADQANCPCYLETSEQRNLAFYERQGFAVVETAILGDGGPPAWAMRREPR